MRFLVQRVAQHPRAQWAPPRHGVLGRGSGVPVHGEQRGLHHVAFGIRQDLIGNEAGQIRWAGLLARLVPLRTGRLQRRWSQTDPQRKPCRAPSCVRRNCNFLSEALSGLMLGSSSPATGSQ